MLTMGDCCCFGEKSEVISQPIQSGGYQCCCCPIRPVVSLKIWYLRFVFAEICIGTTIWSWISWTMVYSKFGYWFLYYTHWTMLLQCVYWILVLYLHFCAYKNYYIKKQEFNKYEKIMFYIMKIANICGVTAGSVLCVTYWVFLYKGDTRLLVLSDQIFKHGLNALLIVIDYYYSLLIWRFKDIYIIIIYTVMYQLFNILYVINGGKDETGNDYLYPIWDFNNDLNGA
eukprot:69904_1